MSYFGRARSRAALLLALVALLALGSALAGCTPKKDYGQVKVTLLDGSTKTIKLAEVTEITGKGGYKKSTGTMVGPNTFKGVKVLDVIAKAGGMGTAAGVQVVATDGYTLTYSKAQLEGNVLRYDADGDALSMGGVTAMLAYDEDGKAKFDGSPRFVYTASDTAWTDGHYWIKFVDTLKLVSAVSDWTINMSGVEEVVLDRATYESMVTCGTNPHPAVTFEMTEKDGSVSVYEGAPLWLLLSMIDGGDAPGGHYLFNDAAAEAGYTVIVVAADGFEAEFESAMVARNNDIIVAYLCNGQPLGESDAPLKLVGSALTSGKQRVKTIGEIRIEGIK